MESHDYDLESDLEGPKFRMRLLLNEGTNIESTSKLVDISKRPSYFDEDRFKRAQRTCNRYYSNISMASTTGLIVLVQIESIIIPLLRTGRSRTVPELFDRYVGTAKYIRKCYETDFYQSTSEGWKSISLVRGMHQRVHRLMNEDPLTEKLTPPKVWVNQYDMAITQFAFIALFLLNPIKCGAYYITEEELLDVTYYWRVLSYYFGIEDRFNIFSYDDNLCKQLELMDMLLNHMKNDLLKSKRNRVGLEMAKGIVIAFEDFSTYLSFNILDHWWSPFISISGQDKPEPYTLSDCWKLVTFFFYFHIIFRIKMIQDFFTDLYKKKFDRFCADGDKIKLKLANKYKHLIYE